MKSYILCRECGSIVPTEQIKGHYDIHAPGCIELFDKDSSERIQKFKQKQFTALRKVDLDKLANE